MRTMVKWGAVITILAIITVVAGWQLYPKTAAHDEGFEEDFGGWTGDADVPPDPNNKFPC